MRYPCTYTANIPATLRTFSIYVYIYEIPMHIYRVYTLPRSAPEHILHTHIYIYIHMRYPCTYTASLPCHAAHQGEHILRD